MLLAQAVEVERAVAPEPVVRVLASAARGTRAARARTPARARTRLRPSASTSTSRPIRSPAVGGEAGRDRAAERVPDQRRRRRAGALDQRAEPGDHALGVERPPATSEAPWPGRSGAITRWRRRQLRDHAHPVGRVAARPVQQDDRRAVAALQHGGRDAGQLQPPLRDRESRPAAARARPSVAAAAVIAVSSSSLRGHRATAARGARPRFRGTTQLRRRRRGWFHPPERRQTSVVLVRERAWPRRARTRRAWRRCCSRAGRRSSR